jgi:hypothetical protein
MMIKTIGLFCGSSMGFSGIYKEQSALLASILADNAIDLVYGGAEIGLMNVVADIMLKSGRKVYGVMPQMLVDKEIAHQNLTKMYVVESMHERKALMAEMSDAFIALPGGFGTLDELAEALTWYQLEIGCKPVGIFNINSYYDHLLMFLDRCVEEGYLRHEHRQNIVVSNNAAGLIKALQSFKPLPVDHKWVDELKNM